MKILKRYYENVCKKRQQELKEMWSERTPVSYRWQDIIKEALAVYKK